jgi:aspartyl aminopeptidase
MSENRNVWEKRSYEEVDDFCKGYMDFLQKCKTERECASEIRREAESKGFVDIAHVSSLKPGDRVYAENRHKNIILAVVGKSQRARIIASHIDAPRLDLKQKPVYEDGESRLGMLETHYYGGVRKYQWLNLPLAIHGVVVKKDGSPVEVCIGEDDGCFIISDLPPHLGKKQDELKLTEAVKGEDLNIIASSLEAGDKEGFKKNILNILESGYGIKEEDLISADLEAVPALKPKSLGFDRSMIGAYGQDDRACAYTSMRAIIDASAGEDTIISIFADKEEIGSDGSTGMSSAFFENFVRDLIEKCGSSEKPYRFLENSKAISADVTTALHPDHKDVQDVKNAARLGFGIAVEKFTGHGGKYGASEATAEFVAEMRRVFEKDGICWQSDELSKVDEGGGGTVAKFLAKYNMDVIDAGPALLGMHSPFELSSKADIYESYRAYRIFFSG